jgi:hypothetical protein
LLAFRTPLAGFFRGAFGGPDELVQVGQECFCVFLQVSTLLADDQILGDQYTAQKSIVVPTLIRIDTFEHAQAEWFLCFLEALEYVVHRDPVITEVSCTCVVGDAKPDGFGWFVV